MKTYDSFITEMFLNSLGFIDTKSRNNVLTGHSHVGIASSCGIHIQPAIDDYKEAYEIGWVRFVVSTLGSISIAGRKKDILKAKVVLNKILSNPPNSTTTANTVYVDVFNDKGDKRIGSKHFTLLSDKTNHIWSYIQSVQ